MAKLVIYTKFCLECVYDTEYQAIKSWAIKNNVDVTVLRTAYNPLHHSVATKYRKDYLAFGVYRGRAYDLDKIPEIKVTERKKKSKIVKETENDQ